MNRTEEEAKKKWCPMVNFQIGPETCKWQGLAYTNRGEVMNPPDSIMCIGSDCMLWKWSYTPEEAKGNKNGGQGYCGLAK
jgi:hypothetical protein